MMGYFKRLGDQGATSQGGDSPPPKRPRTSQQVLPSSPLPLKDPVTIVTWNANGLGVRMGKDWKEFQDFMVSVMPDVCCIQEVGGLRRWRRDEPFRCCEKYPTVFPITVVVPYTRAQF